MQIKRCSDFSLHKNKKGAIEITLIELIGALLFVLIGGVIFITAAKLSGIFLSGKDYESTIKSFDLLGEKIDELVKDKNYANANMLYFLDSQYILVGFNYKDTTAMKSCKNELLTESKKKIGGLCSGACLCIYKNTYGKNFDEDPQTPLQCKSFNENIVFLASSTQDIFCSFETGWSPKSYNDYYQADNKYKFLITPGFNTKEIYMDKYKSLDGNIFIFLAEYKNQPNDHIYKRKNFMEENYNKNLQEK